jgi:RNA polymerase sigma-70 factor, ECF subfamily
MAVNTAELSTTAAPPGPSEPELIARAKSGDNEALGTLWQNYAPDFKRSARRVGFGPEDSEDIVQDMGLKIGPLVQMYSPDKGKFSTFVIASVRNLRVDQRRRNNVRPQLGSRSKLGDDPLDLIPDPNNSDPESELIDMEKQVSLKKALEKLPFAQRVVLEIGYYAKISQEEVAQLLNKPSGTIKTQFRLGLQKIRASMAEIPQVASPEVLADFTLENIGRKRILKHLVTQLPPNQAAAYALRFLCGHTTEETSQALNLPLIETRHTIKDAFNSLYVLAQPQKPGMNSAPVKKS